MTKTEARYDRWANDELEWFTVGDLAISVCRICLFSTRSESLQRALVTEQTALSHFERYHE